MWDFRLKYLGPRSETVYSAVGLLRKIVVTDWFKALRWNLEDDQFHFLPQIEQAPTQESRARKTKFSSPKRIVE